MVPNWSLKSPSKPTSILSFRAVKSVKKFCLSIKKFVLFSREYGAPNLAEFACRLFSIPPNSATSERVWSLMEKSFINKSKKTKGSLNIYNELNDDINDDDVSDEDNMDVDELITYE
ncbi:hypothetical protein RIR_jg12891.t3 [Rhizophagus irregularis DAOM 181602=DAOM 197198]|uniref:HAT C-terminal dimerisation domain-containing protein n=1 Tax=Rhizophagus irregularis (strain DAOM 181602 / DAOM 197198 / MUCL 43194) TaxID=747089 RepID=U9T3P9_RHIID|nr:hypothetical protein RIR_jg12891.t3 [Rhizophagus irregularis DAOM 181602=DAOM 197198]